MALLHAHGGGDGIVAFLDEVVLHGFLDTLWLVPFLFLTYLLMEWVEHRASDKAERVMRRAGVLSPIVGAAAGALPQCGFSAAAASLYTGRVIGLGTLLAVFLSTSDEMLPVLISGAVNPLSILIIICYKLAVAVLVGVATDLLLRVFGRGRREIDIDAFCESDGCHCERGIFYSALRHTLTVSLFVLITSLLIGSVVFFVGEQTLSAVLRGVPVLSHLVAAIVGLVPTCAVSVALTTLSLDGIITAGAMMAGLFSSAGVGVLVLFRVNKRLRENLLVLGILVSVGTVFGLVFDLFFPAFLA